ncbi:MAG: O-acetyl-ADP-ribose deacetylase [Deltaproteobacteria bacterium]|nr:O-acetyl-ADP-ribose deacetylase [Deltaproteobacteria bacterium]
MSELYLAGRLELLQDDITQLEVDAIVNAANTSLMGGGGVDGAIHDAAGPRLLEACASLGGCPCGEARVTEGFDLPARWVIHAVGPQWRGGAAREAELLESAYRASLRRAVEVGARSVAFPAISTGIYAYPLEAATLIALSTIASALEDAPSIERVIAVAFSARVHAAYRRAAEHLFGAPEA